MEGLDIEVQPGQEGGLLLILSGRKSPARCIRPCNSFASTL